MQLPREFSLSSIRCTTTSSGRLLRTCISSACHRYQSLQASQDLKKLLHEKLLLCMHQLSMPQTLLMANVVNLTKAPHSSSETVIHMH